MYPWLELNTGFGSGRHATSTGSAGGVTRRSSVEDHNEALAVRAAVRGLLREGHEHGQGFDELDVEPDDRDRAPAGGPPGGLADEHLLFVLRSDPTSDPVVSAPGLPEAAADQQDPGADHDRGAETGGAPGQDERGECDRWHVVAGLDDPHVRRERDEGDRNHEQPDREPIGTEAERHGCEEHDSSDEDHRRQV